MTEAGSSASGGRSGRGSCPSPRAAAAAQRRSKSSAAASASLLQRIAPPSVPCSRSSSRKVASSAEQFLGCGSATQRLLLACATAAPGQVSPPQEATQVSAARQYTLLARSQVSAVSTSGVPSRSAAVSLSDRPGASAHHTGEDSFVSEGDVRGHRRVPGHRFRRWNWSSGICAPVLICMLPWARRNSSVHAERSGTTSSKRSRRSV
mmetsp:Transcript_23184/g.65472  ORF Transcript_23184/g.65472 Transcript_23184/m.65472 type:complete len:207 (+) Transcript_23184:1793-2413(+)